MTHIARRYFVTDIEHYCDELIVGTLNDAIIRAAIARDNLDMSIFIVDTMANRIIRILW